MEKSSPSEKLHEQIAYLEQKKTSDFLLVKKQLRKTGESLKPSNMVKSALQDVTSDTQIQSVFKKAVFGLVIALITKKVLSPKKNKTSHSLTKTILRAGVNLLISNRYALLKTIGGLAISAVAARMQKQPKAEQEGEIELSESSPSSFSYNAH